MSGTKDHLVIHSSVITHTYTHTHTHTFITGLIKSLVLPKTPQTVYQEKDKEFPENMKLKHIQDFQKEKQEFEEKIAQFGEHHSELV